MFGYLKFYKELGDSYYSRFKKYYCYLCRSLNNKYGFASRFVLSFDITFFLLTIVDENYLSKLKKITCINKISDYYENYAHTDKIAALNILVASAKLEDDILDENSKKSKFAMLCLSKAIKKAKKNHPNLCNIINEGYKTIRKLERDNACIEELETAFSKIICDSARLEFGCVDENRLKILEFTTKWLYFIDAFNDYEEDFKKKRFNPITFETNSYKERFTYFYKHMKNLYTLVKRVELINDENYKIAYIIATDVVSLTNYKILKEKRLLK